MAVTFGFYNSLDSDRVYSARQFSSLFDGLINDGVFMSIGNKLIVTPGTDMQVLVQTGRAWFNNTWTLNDANLPLSIDAAEVVLNRIDVVVLEINLSDASRTNSFKIVKGTAGSVPAVPTLENGPEIFQYPLAHVSVPAGTTVIVGGLLTNKVGTTSTPFVTGILSTISVDDLLAQWEAEFDIWFDNLVNELSENQVTNLQAQIDTLEDDLELLEVEAGKALVYLVAFGATESLKVGDGAQYFTVPPGFNLKNLVAVSCSVITKSTSGIVTVQISRGVRPSAGDDPYYYDMLSTRLTIDQGEYSSIKADTQAVIDPLYKEVLKGNVIRIDVDGIGTGVKGLDVALEFES